MKQKLNFTPLFFLFGMPLIFSMTFSWKTYGATAEKSPVDTNPQLGDRILQLDSQSQSGFIIGKREVDGSQLEMLIELHSKIPHRKTPLPESLYKSLNSRIDDLYSFLGGRSILFDVACQFKLSIKAAYQKNPLYFCADKVDKKHLEEITKLISDMNSYLPSR